MKTLDNSTTAAVPGGLAVSREKYLEYYQMNAADRRLCWFSSRLPWITRYMPFIGPRVVHWTRTREHLRHGCLNPAMILDSESGLIAVFTNLTARGEKPTPVVKILHERLDMIDHAQTINGSGFAAASIYFCTQTSWAQGCWSDFSPIVVDCLVDDSGSCEAAKTRIKPLAWKALKIALKKLDGNNQKGLYHVHVPDDVVRNAY
jgi:hypothetical protein